MPAINIFAARADYISGKEKSLKLAEVGKNFSVHRGESFNIDMGTFVNRMWYAFHHKKSEIPKLQEGLGDWLLNQGHYTHGHECASRFIYGNWNTMNLKGAYGWCLLTNAPNMAEQLRLHLRNYHTILALSSSFKKRPGSKGGAPVLASMICGDRSFSIDAKDDFDSKGRINPADNLDGSPVDYHLADEMGTAAPVGPYRDQVNAFKRVANRTWRSLTVEEIGLLNRQDEEALKQIVGYLSEGPFFKAPIEILKTTEGVAFVNTKTKGGSTSAIQAMIWTKSKHPNWRNLGWWGVDEHFRWVTTDSPKRKAGRPATARILKQGPNLWTIEAVSSKNDHYDVAQKKLIGGPVFATLEGELVFHLKWGEAGTTIEFPSGVSVPGDEPSKGEESGGSCWDSLKRLIGR